MRFADVLEGLRRGGVADGDADLLSAGSGAAGPEVTGVDYDSRRVKPGFVFVAMRGETTDGNRYIDAAIKAGAVAVVSDSVEETPRAGVAWATVQQGRRALAVVSGNFYGHPERKLALTGITGTNGKTTTAFITEGILTAAGRKSGLVGTIEYHVAGRVVPAPHTTPEALELQQIFAESLAADATEVVMEASSHALAQGRVWGLRFDTAIFTNLTRDHLDYHKTFAEYFGAKRLLFEGEGCGVVPPRVAVINTDDAYGKQLAEISVQFGSQVLRYGLADGDVVARDVDVSQQGTRFQLVTPAGEIAVDSPLLGRVNVYNILAASAAAFSRGCTLQQIAAGVASVARVPGRFERVDGGQPFSVVVDYAHTDDALRNLTALAREFVEPHGGRVITLFGCGGDRDRAKRPLMGEAAGNGSDYVVLTSDNPRSENPLAIMIDAVVGLQRTPAKHIAEPDRHRAIRMALEAARPGDIVLLAGKGHEKAQVTREGTFPFDDVAVATEELAKLGYEPEPAR